MAIQIGGCGFCDVNQIRQRQGVIENHMDLEAAFSCSMACMLSCRVPGRRGVDCGAKRRIIHHSKLR
jgi:hypothetical protein